MWRRGQRAPCWSSRTIDQATCSSCRAGTVVCGAHIFDTDRSVQFIHASEFFPLNAVVLDELTLSYYTAVTPCRLMRLPAQEIRVLLDREPAFARAVLTETSYYCRDLIREKQGLYIRSGADRLAAWLLAEAHRAKAHGPHEVLLPKGKISEILDFAPEMLSRYLATLRDHGVSSTQTAILIDDPDALAAFLKPQHRERLTNAAHMPFGRLRAS